MYAGTVDASLVNAAAMAIQERERLWLAARNASLSSPDTCANLLQIPKVCKLLVATMLQRQLLASQYLKQPQSCSLRPVLPCR